MSEAPVQPNLLSDPFCSEASRLLGEELWGTAYLLCAKTGITDLAHFRLRNARASGEGRWAVEFAAAHGGTHALQLARESTGVMRLESCAARGSTEIGRYQLIHHTVLESD